MADVDRHDRRAKVHDNRCQEIEVEIPSGYVRKDAGACRPGDCYWNWPRGTWMSVRDSHTFLDIPAKLLECVITPDFVATHKYRPMTLRCGQCGLSEAEILAGEVSCHPVPDAAVTP